MDRQSHQLQTPSATPYLKLREAAALVQVCTRTLSRWAGAGHFPQPIRIGHPNKPQLRFLRAVVEQFLSGVTQGVANAG